MRAKPLCIDLYCGLGGWAHGFLAEGYDVVGFDIERHRYLRAIVPKTDSSVKRPGLNWSDRNRRGSKDAQFNRPLQVDPRLDWEEYPGQLVIQDVLTLHGSQFRDAAVIVASPPCQAYSYRAMPWKRAKALPPPSNELFEACFRIAKEAGVPIVVENVRGAEKWVGAAAWHFGSYYLWGDVPVLMPPTLGVVMKVGVAHRPNGETNFHGSAKRAREGQKSCRDGLGGYGGSFGWNNTPMRRGNSKSSGRKATSAQIAKIPFPLAQHIARVFKPAEYL